VGIYVHWNGGRDSIEGFLQACKELGYRAPGSDACYGMAQLVRAIGTFFGDGLSLGIGTCGSLDCQNGDNGVYLIGGNWEIVGRMHHSGREQISPETTAGIAAEIVHKIRAACEATTQKEAA
jgi:hypothetical protein